MESLVTVMLIVFAMLAREWRSEASLIAGGRTKKLMPEEKRGPEAPYICLDPPIDLSPCNFSDESASEETSPRHRRAPAYHQDISNPIGFEDTSSGKADFRQYNRPLTIVYKIEGCIVSRLPFVLPFCQEKDSIGRIVEVRRLFPFRVTSGSTKDSGIPLVFPELDMNEWHKFMNGPWTRPVKAIENVKISSVDSFEDDSRSESVVDKLRKRKKFETNGLNEKIKTRNKRKYYDEFEFFRGSSENADEMNLKKKIRRN